MQLSSFFLAFIIMFFVVYAAVFVIVVFSYNVSARVASISKLNRHRIVTKMWNLLSIPPNILYPSGTWGKTQSWWHRGDRLLVDYWQLNA